MGCTGWGYHDVLPYFIKSEDNANKELVKSGISSICYVSIAFVGWLNNNKNK